MAFLTGPHFTNEILKYRRKIITYSYITAIRLTPFLKNCTSHKTYDKHMFLLGKNPRKSYLLVLVQKLRTVCTKSNLEPHARKCRDFHSFVRCKLRHRVPEKLIINPHNTVESCSERKTHQRGQIKTTAVTTVPGRAVQTTVIMLVESSSL
jgi:hypothetical protein